MGISASLSRPARMLGLLVAFHVKLTLRIADRAAATDPKRSPHSPCIIVRERTRHADLNSNVLSAWNNVLIEAEEISGIVFPLHLNQTVVRRRAKARRPDRRPSAETHRRRHRGCQGVAGQPRHRCDANCAPPRCLSLDALSVHPRRANREYAGPLTTAALPQRPGAQEGFILEAGGGSAP